VEKYNPKITETKWQKFFEEKKPFKSLLNPNAKKFYCLEMFPYPSGNIHMGHVRNYTLGDVIANFKRLNGYNVLHPMGWDAFGLPAENAAIQNKLHPKIWTETNINLMKNQLKLLGLSIDWDREISTCSENYFKHQQKIFSLFFKKGLAYKKESYVNWDPIDKTVLANEQVIDGRGWRSGAEIEKKKLNQWFLKISKYSEKLLKSLDHLSGWPEKVKTMQKNWIGKSEGCEIKFKTDNNSSSEICIFTTRPDTIFGASFIGISIDHPFTKNIKDLFEYKKFLELNKNQNISEASIAKRDKVGFKTSFFAYHPFTKKKLPIYVVNFVLMDFGTGAVFGCPAHDQRDFDFAKKYNLEIIQVVSNKNDTKLNNLKEAFVGDGYLVNSEFLNGLSVDEAKKKIINTIQERKIGNIKINYKLKDWGISRQRYWGCPIPILYREDGEVVIVPDKDLPVQLPEDIDFSKSGNPLENHPTWKFTKCPYTGMKAVRETDTLDTFVDSSWYFLRFCSSKEKNEPFNIADINYWMPVDQYTGGIEHAILHLLYSRFFTLALSEEFDFKFKEPFKNLFTQGMVCHPTFKKDDGEWIFPSDVTRKGNEYFLSNGKKAIKGDSQAMSKSKKNVINPNDAIEMYGADAVRWFILSDSPPERDIQWSEEGINGAFKYIQKIWKTKDEILAYEKSNSSDLEIEEQFKKLILEITNLLEKLHINVAIAKLYVFLNLISESLRKELVNSKILKDYFKKYIVIVSTFVPHIANECWVSITGNKDLYSQKWPVVDSKSINKNKTFIIVIQINGKKRAIIETSENEKEDEILKKSLRIKSVETFLLSKKIKNKIYIKNKILNIVTT